MAVRYEYGIFPKNYYVDEYWLDDYLQDIFPVVYSALSAKSSLVTVPIELGLNYTLEPKDAIQIQGLEVARIGYEAFPLVILDTVLSQISEVVFVVIGGEEVLTFLPAIHAAFSGYPALGGGTNVEIIDVLVNQHADAGLSVTPGFATLHGYDYKTPIYLIHLDGEAIDYCNHAPLSPTNTLKKYLVSVGGGAQTIIPEQGRASISGLKVALLDKDQEITALIGGDTYQHHRTKVEIKAGYLGLAEEDLEDIGTGWITGIDASKDNSVYTLDVTDPQKWMQRKLFRGANKDNEISISGNPINILLRLLLSTGDSETGIVTAAVGSTLTDSEKSWADDEHNGRTLEITSGTAEGRRWDITDTDNATQTITLSDTSAAQGVAADDTYKIWYHTEGIHDVYDSDTGLGIDPDDINFANIEDVRDRWYPQNAYYMSFTIDKPVQAKSWFEKELFKILNIYPIIDNDGKFNIKPYKPPQEALVITEEFDESNIIGIPKWSLNLGALINEVEWHYDWDTPTDDKFNTIDFYADGTSINNRGPGKTTLKLESKGLLTTKAGAAITEKRKKRIFERYSDPPPPKLSFQTHFKKWQVGTGDVVKFTHSKIPNMEDGTMGVTEERMEVIKRTIDWMKGRCKWELLATEFQKNIYCTISPRLRVASGISQTQFDGVPTDVAHFKRGMIIDMLDYGGRLIAQNLTITSIIGTVITVSPAMGYTPAAGWVAVFATYDNVTASQQRYGYIADSTGLGINYQGLVNGGFDSDTTGWIQYVSAQLASVAGGQSGNCLQVTSNAAGASGAGQFIYTNAGDVLALSYYVKSGTEATYTVEMVSLPSSTLLYQNSADAAGDWSTFDTGTNLVIPAGDIRVRLVMFQTATGPGDTIFFDTVVLTSTPDWAGQDLPHLISA